MRRDPLDLCTTRPRGQCHGMRSEIKPRNGIPLGLPQFDPTIRHDHGRPGPVSAPLRRCGGARRSPGFEQTRKRARSSRPAALPGRAEPFCRTGFRTGAGQSRDPPGESRENVQGNQANSLDAAQFPGIGRRGEQREVSRQHRILRPREASCFGCGGNASQYLQSGLGRTLPPHGGRGSAQPAPQATKAGWHPGRDRGMILHNGIAPT